MSYDLRFTICALLCLLVPAVSAHDSPEHVVELLTARMKKGGRTAELLWRRAAEHRALDQLAAAAADLRDAIALKPDFLAAQADLGRVQLQLGKTKGCPGFEGTFWRRVNHP